MVAAASQPSLLEDWRQRRQRLVTGSRIDRYTQFQIRLLDFLIRRYGNSRAANMPARSPRRSGPHTIGRAVVVRQELSRRRRGNVRSAADAQRRVSEIILRMSDPAQSETGASAGAFEAAVDFAYSAPRAPTIAEIMADRAGDLGADDWESACILVGCHAAATIGLVVWAWRRRVAVQKIDQTTHLLRCFLLRPEISAEVAERMRAALSDESACVRLEATAFLGRIGTLEDIGLLMDLLDLPPSDDEDPRERQGIALAMRRISAR